MAWSVTSFEGSAPSMDLLQEKCLLLHPLSLGWDVAVSIWLFSRMIDLCCMLATGIFC